MMCDPCFMDANQVGYVHELTLRRGQEAAGRRGQHQAAAADDGAVLGRRADDLADLPRRGPLRARRSATSASRRPPTASASPRSRTSRVQAREAGMRIAYLQFDGVSEEANAHRKVGNLFDVKLRAIEALHAAGIDVCLVVTIVNTVNDDQVGPDHQVRAPELRQDQLRLVPAGVVHGPRRGHHRRRAPREALHAVAPGGGREAPDRGHRAAARLVSAVGVERALRRHRPAARARAPTGARSSAAAIPDCGVGTAFMVSKKTKEWAPLAVVHQRRPVPGRRRRDRRRGPRPVPDEGPGGAEPPAELHRRAGRRRASG